MTEATSRATQTQEDARLARNGQVGWGEFDETTGFYESYGGVPLGAVVGRNVKRLREHRVLTQHELAQLWKRHGLNWARSKVSALEAGNRPQVDVADLVIMAMSLGVPLAELFVGSPVGKVELKPEPNAVEIDGPVLQDLFAGSTLTGECLQVGGAAYELHRKHLEEMTERPKPMQADVELAQRIGVNPSRVAQAAIDLFDGRTLTEERDRRVERMGDLTMQERQAHRGHVTRELSVQLEEILNVKKGGKS
jgi:transcriptional regulator with XRE-family HTH domain